ncbi:glycosyltransferase family 2 protein [Mycoplasma sp. ATU-Cv-703]|uniref:glycosyltransferase n=1 Tax=Mycoplasma sp. ATU-Cv-703 TaxID=2498595 RepID=UPI001374A548
MKRPLYSLVIPCYNGQDFLPLALHSVVNHQMIKRNLTRLYEVIVIDDGSTDDSLRVARELARGYNALVRPDFIRVIAQPNGQYGSVINHALKLARGIYFKILDVDDTFSTDDFIKLLYISAGLSSQVDVIVTDHTFEKIGVNKTYRKSFRNYIEPFRIIDTRQIALPSDLITMHSLVYRLDFLRKIKYRQLEGIYYTDSQFALIPLLQVKSFYYVPLPLYRYYVGRDEQSINIKVMVKNASHQLEVLTTIWQQVNLDKIYSRKMLFYAIIALRRLAQWRILIIVKDPSISAKHRAIMNTLKMLLGLQPKYGRLILGGAFFGLVRFTRGYMIATIIRIGAIIYSRFKTNIMAEWG